MTTYTYGGRPGYEVRNRSGAVVLGIQLEFYANHADASNRQNLLGSTTSDAQGAWSFLNSAGPMIWLRDPEGDAFAIEADDPGFAQASDLADVKATADLALSTAQAVPTGGGGGGTSTPVDLSNYYTKAEVGGAIGAASSADRDRANHSGFQSPSTITGTAVITTDPRLSDARTPTTHTHAQSDVTGLATALAGKLDATTLAAALRATDCVITYSGTQPLRATGTTDTLRRVRWVSTTAPSIAAGYAIDGLDVWEKRP